MSTPEEYNAARLAGGQLSARELTELIILAQKALGVRPDGFAGPVTLEALDRVRPRPALSTELLSVNDLGWFRGGDAVTMPAHQSWYGPRMVAGIPRAIVVHTSATGPGTSLTMARRRLKQFVPDPSNPKKGINSWHISIDTDGDIIQMVPLTACAWHAGSNSAQKIPGIGWANYTTVGIELISANDKGFPPAQVEAAKAVWSAIIQRYSIPRQFAMITHASIDPTRRVDPGPEWMTQHAPLVLDAAYA